MPVVLQRDERQLSTEAANDIRIVTKMRWIVEARNGHFRSIYKMLDHEFNIQNARHIGDCNIAPYLPCACATTYFFSRIWRLTL